MRKYSPREEVMTGRGPTDTSKDYAIYDEPLLSSQPPFGSHLWYTGGGHLIKGLTVFILLGIF